MRLAVWRWIPRTVTASPSGGSEGSSGAARDAENRIIISGRAPDTWCGSDAVRIDVSQASGRGRVARPRERWLPLAVIAFLFVAGVAVSTDHWQLVADGRLVFSSNFSGTQLDTSVWDTCYVRFVAATGCTNFGNPQEEEWYLPSQVDVSGGVLHLIARETPTVGRNSSGAPKIYPYRSGMVTTYSSFRFTYGLVRVVARLPGGIGTWPALWLLPANGSWPPEIDIMENFGLASTELDTFHWASGTVPRNTGRP